MCGIIGYVGNKQARPTLIKGLHSLEYRGYDSAGIAEINLEQDEIKLDIVKTTGKVSDLEQKLLNHVINESTCGIGHTRWATHGKVNDINSHPHIDSTSNIALVHNGIIKNFFEIKTQLENQGIKFKTETDTEVIAELFAQHKKQSSDSIEALRKTVNQLEGSFALGVLLNEAGEEKIYLAKYQSPLVIGVGEGENFIASDSATVLQFTNKVLRLKDEQIAVVKANDIHIEDFQGQKVDTVITHASQTSSILEKGPYKHFLLKEIHEQPIVISKMLEEQKPFSHIGIDFKTIDRITFVACGSAYHASLIGKNLIESFAKVPVDIAIASEFCSNPTLVTEHDLIIGVSQSGETADTLAAMNSAQKAGAKLMTITNKADSAIYDLCDPNCYVTPAGIEISVASTKAFTSQVMSLYLLALHIAEERHDTCHAEFKNQLRSLPLIIDQCLERAEIYRKQFIKYSNYRDFLFLSRGVNYPIALEGALKLKELSYIHATGYPSGEMKHGPIAILDQNVPVLSIAIDGQDPNDHAIYKKTLSNAQEAKARMSPSLVIACDSNQDASKLFDEVICIPDIDQKLSPIAASIPLQFLAYYIAEDLGKDVDQPRNLAKSVTVE